MSQRRVEEVLGRLITDGRFRRRFFEAPEQTCLTEMYDVTPREMEALLGIAEFDLAALAENLDHRIVRAESAGPASLWEEDCVLSTLSVALARVRDN